METVDIYDKNRKRTGKTRLKSETLQPGEYICIAHVVVFNRMGEMLIQQRTDDKIDWPGRWDITAGGGGIAGETPAQTAQRELWEELGIPADLTGARPALTVSYDLGFDDYYIVNVDGLSLSDIKCQAEEVKAVQWASMDTILQMMAEDRFVRYKEGFIQYLFALKDGGGSYDRPEIR